MLAGEGHQTFGQADKTYTEGALIDHALDSIVRAQMFGAVPEACHQQGELLGPGCLLEVKAFAELTGSDLEHFVEFLEETGHALLGIDDAHTLDSDTHDIDGREADIAASYRGLFTETVFKHSCAATHSGYLIFIAFGIVGAPFLMLVEGGVEVDEVGEETAGGHLAGELIEIIVGVFRQIAHSALFLPDLYREDRRGAVAYSLVGGVEKFAYDATSLGRGVGAVVDRTEYHLIASARVDGVHVVDKGLHRLVDTGHGLVDGVLQQSLFTFETFELLAEIVLELSLIEMGEVFAGECLEVFYLLDKRRAHKRGQIEVKGRDGLAAVHFILGGFERDTPYDAGSLYALGGARLAVTGYEAVFKYAVERMLHTGETLGRVIVFVVYVKIAVVDSLAHLGREQIVVDKGLGGLAGKLHHHARGRVGVHVGVLAGDVVALGLDDLEKHVAGLGAASYRPLIAVGDIAFGHLLTGRFHEFELDTVLYLLYAHLFVARHGDAVGYTRDEGLVLAHLGGEHCFAYGCLDFLFVVAYYAPVALYHCAYHGVSVLLNFGVRGMWGRGYLRLCSRRSFCADKISE